MGAWTHTDHFSIQILTPCARLGFNILEYLGRVIETGEGHKYPKMKGDHLYGRTDMHGCIAIPVYFFNPCFRVLMAWDKYLVSSHMAVLGRLGKHSLL